VQTRIHAGDATEGTGTALVESYTAQIPSGVFLGAAAVSVLASLALGASKRGHGALFVGQWVAPFLLLGIYNKMVKQHGSDATDRVRAA
jgi:hypothetical protein